MDWQFHMAGKASQSWWKAKEEQRRILHGGRQESMCRGIALYKTVNSLQTIHYRENSMGEQTDLHDSIIYHNVGIMGATIQDEIWVETKPNPLK